VSELLARISRAVRIRFSLSAAEFSDRVESLAGAHAANTGRPIEEHFARLSLDDLYLATACVRGEERAWQELSATHADFMREFARRFLSGSEAREVADEVLADLWERGKLAQYEGRSTLRTWLGTVIAHAALNSRKARSRFVPLDEARERAQPAVRIEPADQQASDLLRDLLATALRELPAENRLLLQLYYEQGLTLDELSVTLRASSASLSRRLKRTREGLRAAVDDLTRRQAGASADAIRDGLDLARIEIDLSRLLGGDAAATGDRYEVV
jgi:RNA polymerase sigma-70 factor (ECF subfamily)